MVKEILLLGNPALYQRSSEVVPEELNDLRSVIEDLHDTLVDFRRRQGPARAIAAPQIGVFKRLIYAHIDDESFIILNPILLFPNDEEMEVLDDCMSFPGLKVRVRRHRQCLLRYRNLDWQPREAELQDDMAELIQHEYDHLDGVLATMRAVDSKAFVYQPPRGGHG